MASTGLNVHNVYIRLDTCVYRPLYINSLVPLSDSCSHEQTDCARSFLVASDIYCEHARQAGPVTLSVQMSSSRRVVTICRALANDRIDIQYVISADKYFQAINCTAVWSTDNLTLSNKNTKLQMGRSTDSECFGHATVSSGLTPGVCFLGDLL